MAVISFECKKCGEYFCCDVGEISFELVGDRPQFEKEIRCPDCGVVSMDEVWLTEVGQTQLTQLQLAEDEKGKGKRREGLSEGDLAFSILLELIRKRN